MKAFSGELSGIHCLSNRAQMVGGGHCLLPEIFGEKDLPLQKRRLPIDMRSWHLSRITPSEKVLIALI